MAWISGWKTNENLRWQIREKHRTSSNVVKHENSFSAQLGAEYYHTYSRQSYHGQFLVGPVPTDSGLLGTHPGYRASSKRPNDQVKFDTLTLKSGRRWPIPRSARRKLCWKSSFTNANGQWYRILFRWEKKVKIRAPYRKSKDSARN